MSQLSNIEWTDVTWNPVTGCTKVSQGCKHCYAERLYERFNGKGSFRNVICHEDRFLQPFKRKKPSRIFVNSMSDLFHEDVPFQFIDKVYDTMWCTPRHTYQVLTKRADRMQQYCSNIVPYIPNVWQGVSVEDQKTADERIPLLTATHAVIRFLSMEPLLGPVDLSPFLPSPLGFGIPLIDWVIVGGESGPGARPMHPQWVRDLRDQCKEAGIAFFFKQWGEYAPAHDLQCNDKGIKGRKWFTFDPDTSVCRVGKKAAGRLLDGKEYNAFPQTSISHT